jgi:NAD(P)-dependent dehydrogenase (short-subunit alcohol dehydrogenase family)
MGHFQYRVAAVTGATGAIGKAIARQLAQKSGFEVVLLCRNARRAERAVAEIRKTTQNDKVRYELVDLSSLASIRNLASSWSGPMHVLVNNAAITSRTRKVTEEGLELQFATNVLGYFRMITAFEDVLKASQPARVVNVASYWAGGLRLDDLQFVSRQYDNDGAYRQSKQADRMLTVAFAGRFANFGVTVNACHSGDVNSALSNDLGFGGHESPDHGAATPVWLATEPVGQETTGQYFEHLRETSCRFGQNIDDVEKLFMVCRKLVVP